MTARPRPDEPLHTAPDLRAAGPTVLRMVVGAQLRRFREAAGISTEDAGYEIRGSHSKISRMELGRVGFKERDIADLLTLYGVTDPGVRDTLLELAAHASTPGWWHAYGDVVPGWYEPYLGLEQGALVARVYEVQDVPELLQTPGYARALLAARHPDASKEEVERRVELRMARRRVFERPDPLKLWAVLDEAVLRRVVGGPRTMRAQIEHLIAMAERPNITVQILPFTTGGHAAESGPVTLLRFAEPELPDVVYLEQLTGALYPDRAADIARYRDVLDRIGVQAEPPSRTPQILRDLLIP
ncbi:MULTISPECIES: helix-turn-helix domain-containing protein [Actinomadura]|uniref:Helix-turn-helix domain-containing protein n=1 Tax=Actinomadura geliboluensis TaxID=882440 RepID=A0A5S4H750_9ACTN|nr:helix-turn-helix transcriptional regulator [Actinomadura geliboluensis]TMR40584.1 helix-turn-helix domain-containing protein [Actinomadura geliboluensis]